MDMLTQELMFVLEGSDGAAERCAAMESLFWLQVSPFFMTQSCSTPLKSAVIHHQQVVSKNSKCTAMLTMFRDM